MEDNKRFPSASLIINAENEFDGIEKLKKHLSGPDLHLLLDNILMGLADLRNHASPPEGIEDGYSFEQSSYHLDHSTMFLVYPIKKKEHEMEGYELTEREADSYDVYINTTFLFRYIRDWMSEHGIKSDY